MFLTAVALGSSLIGASSASRATQKSLIAQAQVDTAQREANVKSLIAQTQASNAQAEQIKKTIEIMETQGKADGVLRKEAYNKLTAMQMVMGAVSGRVLDGQGSVGTIMDKSREDFMWDVMWNQNNLDISKASLESDITEIYRAGHTSLVLGAEQTGVDRVRSQAGQATQARQAQLAFNNTIRRGITGAITSYGTGGVSNLLGVSSSGMGSNNDNGWLY